MPDIKIDLLDISQWCLPVRSDLGICKGPDPMPLIDTRNLPPLTDAQVQAGARPVQMRSRKLLLDGLH